MNRAGDKQPRRKRRRGARGILPAALAATFAAVAWLLLFGADNRGAPDTRPQTSAPDEESLVEGHELRDMRFRQVVLWLALLAVAVTALVLAVTFFEARVLGHVGPLVPVLEDPPRVTPPPQPRLERANGEVLQVQRAREDEMLNNYTWIDEAAGTVSIPIERAIELTLQRGLPVRAQGDEQQIPGLTLPQGSSSGRTVETIP